MNRLCNLRNAIARLDILDYLILKMRVVHGMTNEQVGEEIGMQRRNVLLRWQKVGRFLRAWVDGDEERAERIRLRMESE